MVRIVKKSVAFLFLLMSIFLLAGCGESGKETEITPTDYSSAVGKSFDEAVTEIKLKAEDFSENENADEMIKLLKRL